MNALTFFRNMAPYSYGPNETPEQGRMRCAIDYALAEVRADINGWTLDVVPEEYPDLSWCDCGKCENHTVEAYILRDGNWRVIGSVGNVVDGTRDYERLERATMALELL